MRHHRLRRLVIVVLVATLLVAVAAEAHVRWYVGIGPFWPYPYPGPHYYPPPAVVVEPPVYIEMPPPERYWYYCAPSQTYYPYVGTCPEPWIKVPPSSQRQ